MTQKPGEERREGSLMWESQSICEENESEEAGQYLLSILNDNDETQLKQLINGAKLQRKRSTAGAQPGQRWLMQ